MLKNRFIIATLTAGLFLTGCGASESEEAHVEHANGDLREETVSPEVLPGFMDEKPENVQNIYLAAAQHRDLLESIPCYCGCGDHAGHKDNYDCFVHENSDDGRITWDDHGTKCGVCLEIAASSINDYQQGKSIKKIRADIDKAYENGYAEPTPTPAL